MQKIFLIGYLGKDPEARYTPDGKQIATFSVGVSEKRGEEKVTSWYQITAWEKLAEIAHEYLKKGMKVFIEGKLLFDPKTGGPRLFSRQDGSAGTAFNVVAANIQFMAAKGQDAAAAGDVPD